MQGMAMLIAFVDTDTHNSYPMHTRVRNLIHRQTHRIRLKGTSYATDGIDRIRAEIFVRRVPADAIRTALFFVGSPRSGTTLINTLLCAHPMILLGHEVNAMKRMNDGANWPAVMRRIVWSAFCYERVQAWSGYSYRVSYQARHDPANLRVIGDKAAGKTSTASYSEGFQKFLEWVPYPVTFFHIVRHPMDVISTHMMRSKCTLRQALPTYFGQQKAAMEAQNAVDARRFIRVRLEELIAQPRATLQDIIERLDLPVFSEYLDACASVVFPQPKRSRSSFPWTAESIAEVKSRAAAFPHLQAYCADEASWSIDR